MKTPLNGFIVFSLALIGLIASESSWCQIYPAKPVRLITGGPPAGGADVIVRPIAQRLSESLRQQFIVDNRPGAGSVIAAEMANQKVQVYGDVAILTYNYIGATKDKDGKVEPSRAKSTRVYVKKDGQWWLVHANFAPAR